MSDESGALWMPNANYFPNRGGHKPLYIVLHGSAGGSSAQAIANYYTSTQGGSNPVSSHYIIGTDGVIVLTVLEQNAAWANGYISGPSGVSGDGIGNGYHDTWWNSSVNPNNISLSIEHVKSATDNSNMLTPAQQQASFTLIQHLCQRHNIPMHKADASGGITGHYAIDPLNRSRCPGVYPWTELYKFLAGSSMTTLENFPMISQLADGDINTQFDCVPASLAAAMQYITGIKFNGSEVKDAVYGASYQGATAPQAYIGYCAKYGVLLSPYNGNNAALIATTKEQLAQNHPVLLTEIDPYLPASSGATHAVAAYACNADSVTVMDPYIDQGVTKTDEEWQSDLQSGQIWIVEKETSMVPTGWADNGTTLIAPNKITITLGFREYVLANNWSSSNWPLEEAHGQDPLELSNPSLGSGTVQTFRTSVLEWTPTQGVFVAWSGQEMLKLRALLASQSVSTTPVVTINTQQAISTLQTIDVAIKAVLSDLGAS